MSNAATADLTETFSGTLATFKERHGTEPVTGVWVVSDAEGNSLTGHVVPEHQHRQALAFAGARLTTEVVQP